MRIGVIGVNFKSSSLALREHLAGAFNRAFLGERGNLRAVLLNTCNRTELYFSAEDLAALHSELLSLLRREVNQPFEHVLYSYFGRECFAHLAAVVCGLDSAILAETEIQRQVKVAYAQACLNTTLPSSLHFLFQKCLKIGKGIRAEIPLERGGASLEATLYRLSRLLIKELEGAKLLFVGNSEINRKILAFFRLRGVGEITLCTRTPKSAEELGVRVVSWKALHSWRDYPLVICGTSAGHYLISPEESAVHQETQLIFDLSVPRNVDPQIARHPTLHLFNIEEIGRMVERERSRCLSGVQSAEAKIREAVDRQCAIFHNRLLKIESAGRVCSYV